MQSPLPSASSRTSTTSTPRTPLSIDQNPLQSSPRKRPHDTRELKSKSVFPPRNPITSSSSQLGSPARGDPMIRKRTLEARERMEKIFLPHKLRTSVQPPELRFTMRSLGISSHNSLTLKDVEEGEDVFKDSLRQLSKELFDKLYIAKLASRDCMLSRISTTLREIDALEKTKDVLLEVYKTDNDRVSVAARELDLFREEAQARDYDIENHPAYHAVYADDLAALTVADTQLSYMNPAPIEEDSDSDVTDDVVYDDDARDHKGEPF